MFKSLVSAVSEQRQEIKQALVLFPYFETWNPDLIAECCRVSSISEFPSDEIILGPETRNSHTVYFILEGICKMVRNLDVEVKMDYRLRVMYKLHKAEGLENFYSESRHEGYSSRLFNQKFQNQDINVPEVGSEMNSVVTNELKMSAKLKRVQGLSLEAKGGLEEVAEEKDEREIIAKETSEQNDKPKDPKDHSGGLLTPGLLEVVKKLEGNPQESTLDIRTPSEADNLDKNTTTQNQPQQSATIPNLEKGENILTELPTEEETEQKKIIYEPDYHLKILEECRKRRRQTIWVTRKTSLPVKPAAVKSFFIQIGFLYRGACFGLEKSERENYILSATTVKCLKIPEGFLLSHNPCNIWKRIGLFHSLYLPKNEKIFERFRTDRMWVKGKRKLTADIISKKNLSDYSLICDTPYSVRLSEVL